MLLFPMRNSEIENLKSKTKTSTTYIRAPGSVTCLGIGMGMLCLAV